MSDSPKLWAAVLFNLLYPAGLVVFTVLSNALHPVVSSGLLGALLAGAPFGFFVYATYDLTNLATLKDWPVSLAFIDIAWGTAISGVAAAVGKARRLHPRKHRPAGSAWPPAQAGRARR